MIATWFVRTMLALQIGACAAYTFQHNWKLALYWAFSTGIISVVTYM